MELENGLKTKKLELKLLLDRAAEDATICSKGSQLNKFVEMVGRKKREMVTLTIDVRYLGAN